jgi:hypothetical protein
MLGNDRGNGRTRFVVLLDHVAAPLRDKYEARLFEQPADLSAGHAPEPRQP